MAVRGTPTCRLITSSFASCFLAADELTHLPQCPTCEADWKKVEAKQKELEASVSSLQAHLGEEIATAIGVGYGRIEQGLHYHDITEVNEGAQKIQEVLLIEGLIAIAQECGKTEH